MAINPLIALSALGQPFDPIESYGKILNLRNLSAAGQLQAIQQQEARLRLADLQRQQQQQQNVDAAAKGAVTPEQPPQPTGSPVLSDMLSPGQPSAFDQQKFVSNLSQTEPLAAADYQQKMQEAQLAHAKELQALSDAHLKSVKDVSDLLSNQVGNLMSVDPQYRPQAYSFLRDQLAQQLPQLGQSLPPQYPGDQWLASQAAGSKAFQDAVTNEQARRNAEETARHNKQSEANTIRGQNMADARSREQNAIAKGQQSYQFNSKQLETVAKPVTDAVQRFSRLQDTLAQGTPQADALVAPELLTVMAGGQGSGLRMNEAEIARIVGGRSKLESLKAAANQWQLDPSKANSITPEQRAEIRKLVTTVGQRLRQKQQIIDQANGQLANENDPMVHRQIVTQAKQQLTAVDEQGSGGFTVTSPDGKTFTFSSQAAADQFKAAAGIK